MKFNKFLSIFFIICSVFTNYSSAQVNIEIRQNGDYLVQCNNNNNLFTTTTELSNGLNNLTYNYFKTTSVILDNTKINTLIFKGVETVEPCTLSLKNTANFKPNIIFDCGNNKVKFTKIVGNNINSFKLLSKNPIKINSWISVDTTNNKMKVHNTKHKPIIGAISVTPPYSYFELAVQAE